MREGWIRRAGDGRPRRYVLGWCIKNELGLYRAVCGGWSTKQVLFHLEYPNVETRREYRANGWTLITVVRPLPEEEQHPDETQAYYDGLARCYWRH